MRYLYFELGHVDPEVRALRSLRKRKKIAQCDLERAARLPRGALNRLELGKAKVRPKRLQAIRAAIEAFPAYDMPERMKEFRARLKLSYAGAAVMAGLTRDSWRSIETKGKTYRYCRHTNAIEALLKRWEGRVA